MSVSGTDLEAKYALGAAMATTVGKPGTLNAVEAVELRDRIWAVQNGGIH